MNQDYAGDLCQLAGDLAGFLLALHSVDTADGPPPGEHNFWRGGSLGVYDTRTRAAIVALGSRIDCQRATQVWDAALGSQWDRPDVWVHGDVAPSNLLVADGRLSAVIDFGCCAVGDPACDLTMAWTAFSGRSRQAYQSRLNLDDGTWGRARGWALWKALVTATQGACAAEAARIRFGWRLPVSQLLDAVLADDVS